MTTPLDAIRARLAAHDQLNKDRRESNVLVTVEAEQVRALLRIADAAEALLATGFTTGGDILTQNSIPMTATPGMRRKVAAIIAALREGGQP